MRRRPGTPLGSRLRSDNAPPSSSRPRARLFFDPADYFAFLTILRDAPQVETVRLLAYCLMPNHWHLVVRPVSLMALSSYMHWITTTHAVRWGHHRGVQGTGHLYQDRFKSLPIAGEHHLLAVLRYVESNPVRAGLVRSALDWPYSSHSRPDSFPPLEAWPVPRPAHWTRLLDEPLDPGVVSAIRVATNKGVPLEAKPPEGDSPLPRPGGGLSPSSGSY